MSMTGSVLFDYTNIILIAAGVCAAFGLAAFLLFRLKLYSAISRTSSDVLKKEGEKAVTVVICCHNEGGLLESNLPKIMGQRGVKFEVVVVDDCSDDSTSDVLKRMEDRHPNLRHTFVPATARYVSHAKLAVSLGVKAARNEWIVMTRPGCAPVTDLWLKAMSSRFEDGTDIVLGYANYADNGTLAAGRAVYERMQYNMVWFLSARKKACGGDGGNLAFRRSAFLERDGYAGSLDSLFGDDDLLVDAMAVKGNTAVCCAPMAVVREYSSDLRRAWRNTKLLRTASLMHSPRCGNSAVLAVKLSNLGHFLWLMGWIVAAAVFFVTGYAVATAAAVFAAVLLTLADTLLMRRATYAVGERSYVFLLWWYETVRPLAHPLWKLRARLHGRDLRRRI